ncbi:hypothetical protein TSUD_189300 [Trifolium subterraneum]|uniref:LOB domain-containing protein n=1 Tax=Trifolium subterraneum TaxID=3900 RepID=A0A2Z6LVS7_TRISU|nr:hypothetical protein TSUD_189300 [Trifolium subterraneum]
MHSCAACKHLRRRCDSSCELAPFFPLENPQRFKVVHEVFGRSNVSKMLREIDPSQRENTVDSLVYEVEAHLRDPFNGYLDYVHNLEHQLKELQKEMDNVKSELTKYPSREITQYVMN